MICKTTLVAAVCLLSLSSVSALYCVNNENSFFDVTKCNDLQSSCMKMNAGDSTLLKCSTSVECTAGKAGEAISNVFGLGGGNEDKGIFGSIVGDNDDSNFHIECCQTDLCNNRIIFGTSLYIIIPVIAVLFILFWVIFGCIIKCCCCK